MLINEIVNKNKIDAYTQLEKKNPFQGLLWAGMMGVRENSHFEKLMAETIEENCGYQLTRRSLALREVLCSLSTLSWDFDYFQKLFKYYEDSSLENQFCYLKIKVFDIFENWSGGREMPRLICLGGVRKDLKLGDQKYLKNTIEEISFELNQFIEHCLFDYFIKENLTDIQFNLSENILEELKFWPKLYQSVQLNRINGLEKLVSKACFSKLIKSHAEQSEYGIFYEIYLSRVFRILECLDRLKVSLDNLPEGDFRVIVEHLHIPGNYFVGNKVDAPSGRLYSYYCSGKIRFRSFSTHYLKLSRRSDSASEVNNPALVNALGVDLVQGALCEKAD